MCYGFDVPSDKPVNSHTTLPKQYQLPTFLSLSPLHLPIIHWQLFIPPSNFCNNNKISSSKIFSKSNGNLIYYTNSHKITNNDQSTDTTASTVLITNIQFALTSSSNDDPLTVSTNNAPLSNVYINNKFLSSPESTKSANNSTTTSHKNTNRD